MKSRTQPQFWDAFDKLPRSVQGVARKQYTLWNQNPQHPSLNFKRVGKNPPIYSVRINYQYRALGLVKDGTCYWFWIGHHAEYDRLLK